MQVSSLMQDLVNQIISEIKMLNTRGMDLGDIFSARVKAVQGDTVLIRVQGQDILATTQIPLEVGETINFQFQGMQQGKAVFKMINEGLPDREAAFIAKTLNLLQLPDTETNRETVKQMVQLQLPLDKNEIIQLSNSIKNLALPAEDIGEAVALYKQDLPITKENISFAKALTQDNFQLFKGLGELKNLVDTNPKMSLGLKEQIQNLLDIVENISITPEDKSPEIAAKLSQSISWQAGDIKDLPVLLTNSNDELVPLQSPQINNTDTAPFKSSQTNNSNTLTPTKQAAQENPASPTLQNTLKEAIPDNVSVKNQLDIGKRSEKAHPSISNPEILSKDAGSVDVAGKLIKDHDQLNPFLHNIKEVLDSKNSELKELINKIYEGLNSSNPQEHAAKEMLKDFSDKLTFLDRLIATTPKDSSQQIIFYSQTILKNENQQETPINITIKRPRDQQGKKINYDNCTLTVSLNTENLGLVRASVRKVERTLSCQLQVTDPIIKEFLEPALPELAGSLESLDYQVIFQPTRVIEKNKITPADEKEKAFNLFNVDIRI